MARLDSVAAGGIDHLAFLDTIAWAENGAALLKESDDGYNLLVGSIPGKPITFPSYGVHPHRLVQVHSHNADGEPVDIPSTAAGRYMFRYITWSETAARLYLRDFSPFNQDRAALYKVREHGAIPSIDAGNIADALVLCAKEWASLPTAGYGQHEQKMSDLITVYNAALERYVRAKQ
jgi:muramidase (phage lysozyme)